MLETFTGTLLICGGWLITCVWLVTWWLITCGWRVTSGWLAICARGLSDRAEEECSNNSSQFEHCDDDSFEFYELWNSFMNKLL
jgi:hypothetical protein